MIGKIIALLQENQFLTAGLGVTGAGLFSFWLRDIPLKFFNLLKRHLTTTLIVQNYDIVFYEMLSWIKSQNKNKNFRTLKLSNGKWGSDNKAITSMGYGLHIIKYKHHFLFLDYFRGVDSVSDKVKETISITKLGRSKALFESMIKNVELLNTEDNSLKLYKMNKDWYNSGKIRKRDIKSIFIEKQKKDLIFNNLDKFMKKEKWYISKGIPYQYGILLYGSPGTGKTSLIKAIASKYDYNIYYLTPGNLAEIGKALTTCPEKSIVVIEDIDTNKIVHKRKSNKQENLLEGLSVINLSDILNALDGLSNVHGRMLICTTNHVQYLDKALIRPGRFDLLVEVGFVNKEILKQFLVYYFPKKIINLNKFTIKTKVTVAYLQNMILLGWDCDKILKAISV